MSYMPGAVYRAGGGRLWMVKAVEKVRQEVLKLFTPEQWKTAREYWREGLVWATYYGDGIWQGKVAGSLDHYRVRVRRLGKGWQTECSCWERRARCRHAAALLWGWLAEPEKFTPVEELTESIARLSRTDAVELLYRAALEEAELVKKLLAGADEGKRRRVSLPGLLYLVKSLQLDTGSPWLSRRLWEERWGNLLAAVEDGLQEEPGKAWPALLLLAEKMLDFCLSLAAGETAAGDVAALVALLGRRPEQQIPARISEKLLDYYLNSPLSGEEEEKFYPFFHRLCAVKGGKFLLELLRPKVEGEGNFLAGVRGIRLAAKLLSGTENFQELARWCLADCRRLLPLLDYLEEQGKYREAKNLLQKALPLFAAPSGRYLYRLRLAALHRMLGENRRALYLGVLNFAERPGREEYFTLKRLATLTGDWQTIKPRLWQSMAAKAPALLEEVAIMGERILPEPT